MVQRRRRPKGRAIRHRYLRWKRQREDDRRTKDHRVSGRSLGYVAVDGLLL